MQETSVQWLERVQLESKNPEAKRKAKQALAQWRAMTSFWKQEGLSLRRSLWDLLAGVSERGGKIVGTFDSETVIKTGGREFVFPVFVEALQRRARDPKTAPRAVFAGVHPKSFRAPQRSKWGNDICKT